MIIKEILLFPGVLLLKMTVLSQLTLQKNGVEVSETKHSVKEKLVSVALELGQ